MALVISSFIFLISLASLATGDDRLQAGNILENDQTLTSKNDTVSLGFFSVPGASPARASRYLGIWFNNIQAEFVPLWIANRDRPVSSSAALSLTSQGELQIIENSSVVAWSSSTRGALQAVLLDTGNFLLTDSNATESIAIDSINPNVTILWQSFDHPADVWVPTMRMNVNMNLTAWSSKVSPSSGRFIMRMLQTNEYVLTPINSTRQYWSSGPWNGKIFSNVAQMTLNYLYNFTFDSTPPASFNWFEYVFSHSIFRLEHDGVIRVKWISGQTPQWQTVWPVPTSTCDVLNLCGPNGNCNPGQSPPCSCPDQFKPANETNWSTENWSDGCSSSSGSSSSSSGVAIGLGAAAAGAAVLFLTAGFLIFLKRKRAAAKDPAAGNGGGGAAVYFVDGELTAFTYKQLHAATDGFKHRLGSGGFGEVFRGTIHGEVIAVKKLIKFDDKQFRAEVSTIGTVQHINLVRLRGFCVEGQLQMLLVYEFVENGSLDRSLFGVKDEHAVLDWDTRFSIALGTAKGIAYLHEECRDRIIHCDIKPENILLDAEMKPKVADFGLAKLLGRDFSRVITSMRGTRGYLAPEWLSNLPITPKADVYSYGMTLLEIISGRRNIDVRNDRVYFPVWAAKQLAAGNYAGLPDERMSGWNEEQLERALRTAVWCVQDDEVHRPSMKAVVHMLDGTIAAVPEPAIPTSFQVWLEAESVVQSV